MFKYDAGTDGVIQVRMDSKAGPVISSVAYKESKDGLISGVLSIPVTGRHNVYFYAVKRSKPNNSIIHISTVGFE